MNALLQFIEVDELYTYISKDKDKCKTKHVRLAKKVCKPEMVIIFQSNQRSQYPTFCLSVLQKLQNEQ